MARPSKSRTKSSIRAKFSTSNPVRCSRNRWRLIIGVDFGTTFTSVAYFMQEIGSSAATTGKILLHETEQSISTIYTWQKKSVHSSEVPTTLIYDENGENPLWGFQAENHRDGASQYLDSQKITLPKLTLYHAGKTQDKTNELKELEMRTIKREYGFVLDYFKCLHDFLLDETNGRFYTIYRDVMHSKPEIKWIFGVPAAWNEEAKANMMRLAVEAGMKDATTVSEPEAMAYTYFARKKGPIKVGETYVICDAGGGTVDLTTFTIISLNPFKVKEIAVAEGALHGSIFLDENFKAFIRQKLENLPVTNEEDLEYMVEEATIKFRTSTKTDFSKDSTEYNINLRDLRAYQSPDTPRRGQLKVTAEELRQYVFDPVIDQIRSMVSEHVEGVQAVAIESRSSKRGRKPAQFLKIKSIILGGGFGKNQYLRERLQACFPESSPSRHIWINEEDLGKESVAKGAVLCGLVEGFVAERSSQLNYGIETRQQYDKEDHGPRETNKIISEKGDHERILIVEWIVRRGHLLQLSQTFKRQRFYFAEPVKEGELINQSWTEHIYESPTPGLKRWFTKYKDLHNEAPGKAFSLEIKVKDIPPSELEFNEEAQRYIIVYDVVLQIEGSKMIWTAVVVGKQNNPNSYAEVCVRERPLEGKAPPFKQLGTARNRFEAPFLKKVESPKRRATELLEDAPSSRRAKVA